MSNFDDELKRLLREYQATPNRAIFGEVFALVKVDIRLVFWSCGVRQRSEIDDLSQDLFLKVLRLANDKKVPVDGNPMAWMCRVAINLAKDQFRKKKASQTVPIADNDYPVTDDIYGTADALAELLQGLKDLRVGFDERERLLFEARFDPDKKVTWEGAAIALGWTPRQGQRVQEERLGPKLKTLQELAEAYYGNSMKLRKKKAAGK